jgi:esterase/lipase superfamily enzyme
MHSRRRARAMIRRVAYAMLLATAGCASIGASRRGHVHPLVRDTIWYVSVRARDAAGRDLRAASDSLEYGAAIFERPWVPDPISDPLAFRLRDSLRISRHEFLTSLTRRLAAQPPADDYAVLYVHGFGTGLDECWRHPADASTRAGTAVPWVAFCWPSHGKGIAWPRVGALLVRAYEDDTASVTAAAPAFTRTLADLTYTLGSDRVFVAAHSLGGRMVAEELAHTDSAAAPARDGPATVTTQRLRGIAWLALDHDANRFADTLLPVLQLRAERLVLYTARRDRALTISRRMHDAARAGLAEPNPLVRPALETVDASDAFATDGLFQRLFGNRHAVRRAAGLLWDLTHVVGRRLPASCRDSLGLGWRDTVGVWHLGSAPPREPATGSTCAPSNMQRPDAELVESSR